MTAGGISLVATSAPQTPQIILPTAGISSTAAENRKPSAYETTARDQQAGSVDTVTIMNKVLDSKQETDREEAKKDGKNLEKQSFRTMDDVLFAYNFRGDLRVRFMDSVSKLVYQMPPVLVARVSDLM